MLSESLVEEMEGGKPKGKLNKSTINMFSIQNNNNNNSSCNGRHNHSLA